MTRRKAPIIIAASLVPAAAAALLLALTAGEYRPRAEEPAPPSGAASRMLREGDVLTVLSWNLGYGALGDNADFFMDGGRHVATASRERVLRNMEDMAAWVAALGPDVAFFQEADVRAARSHNVNEPRLLAERLEGYQQTFATNFRVAFIPWPVPPIGAVHAGLATMSAYPVAEGVRVRLPCPFRWPVRVGSLKRCLLVDRIPLAGSSRQLVAVNLHLEAYDGGAGKAAQTRQLRDFLQKEYEDGNYVIAGGDFNQTFSSFAGAYPAHGGTWQPGVLDEGEFGGGWQFAMDASAPSCRSLDRPYDGSGPEDFQFYLIDGFIASPNVHINAVRTCGAGFKSSDHNPVVLTATLGGR